ncbi:MAG: prolyl oligopeptidase family serine peptidase, partial [Polyangiaceae bacterium]
LAGVLPESLRAAQAPEAPPPIVALHGDADPILPIAQTRDTVAALKAKGWNVTLLEYPGVKHQLRGDMQRELYRRIKDAMTPNAAPP